ncbi:DUF4349 domain-containing protein [Ulvibacter antarcticus]|uniref:Uncharacterized protein DUF4349 n=1 Tax=Ulvibacter antarcticus TaxID=442714 RepID=A0A3L9Z1N1_9FLAO|nr:DUF4349 domain-containing protein [Ulvibacter antarcticus]RMA66030.1 uncharacterized protein DUF4349 [Ulvibacter antarcticus]
MKIVSVLLFVILLSCNDNSSTPGPLGETNEISHKEMSESEVSMIEASDDAFTQGLVPTPQEQKIIKTARLVFETKDVEATQTNILKVAGQYKGFIQSDNSGKSYNRLYRNMVIRVPTESFQIFIDGISEGVSYFDQKEINRQDVSEEFVDLQARLKAKRELENRYLELLKQAKNVKEMLEIERELSTIREEIEAKQGRLQFLENRVSMSTISLEFYKLTAETGITQSYGQKMINSLKGGWDGVSVFLLGVLYLWPLFVVALIVVFVLRKILKRNKK